MIEDSFQSIWARSSRPPYEDVEDKAKEVKGENPRAYPSTAPGARASTLDRTSAIVKKKCTTHPLQQLPRVQFISLIMCSNIECSDGRSRSFYLHRALFFSFGCFERMTEICNKITFKCPDLSPLVMKSKWSSYLIFISQLILRLFGEAGIKKLMYRDE